MYQNYSLYFFPVFATRLFCTPFDTIIDDGRKVTV